MKQIKWTPEIKGGWSFKCPHCYTKNKFVDMSKVENYVTCYICDRITLANKPKVNHEM